MRVLGEASLRASERYEDPLSYERLVEEAISLADAARAPSKVESPPAEPAPTRRVPESSAPATPTSHHNEVGVDDGVSATGEKLIANRAQGGSWDAKTCRQARTTLGPFDHFYGGYVPSRVLQPCGSTTAPASKASSGSCSDPPERSQMIVSARSATCGRSAHRDEASIPVHAIDT